MTILQGKLGSWAEEGTKKWISKVLSEGSPQLRRKRSKTRFKGRHNLGALKTLAPPQISPTLSKGVETIGSFVPVVGEAKDLETLASMSEELLRGNKKLSKEAITSLALGFAGIMLPGSTSHASRDKIIQYMHGEARKQFPSTLAIPISSEIASTLRKIPQDKLDKIQSLSFDPLSRGARGTIRRTPTEEVYPSYFNDLEAMRKVGTTKDISLTTEAELWTRSPKGSAKSALAHEFGHGEGFGALERGDPMAGLIFKKEQDLEHKISLFKQLQENLSEEDYALISEFFDKAEYRLSFDEAYANNFAKLLGEAPQAATEAERKMTYRAAAEEATWQTLSRKTKTLNKQLREVYEEVIPKQHQSKTKKEML